MSMQQRFAIVGALFVGAGILALIWLYLASPPLCQNQFVRELISPNEQYRAVLFEKDCGAAARTTTHVSVLRHYQTPAEDDGNAFIASGYHWETIEDLRWTWSNMIVIQTSAGIYVYKAEHDVNDASVVFLTP